MNFLISKSVYKIRNNADIKIKLDKRLYLPKKL